MMPATQFRLERANTMDLVFTGAHIAHADSRDRTHKLPEDRPRWTEIDIYVTDTDKWVVVVAGCTVVDGEEDREVITICETPEDVQEAVRVRSSRVITGTATDALAQAASNDPRLGVTLEERV